MPEHSWLPTAMELEAALIELGRGLAYPRTPDLATAVRGRLPARRPAGAGYRRMGWLRPAWRWPPPLPHLRRSLTLALLALLLLASIAVAWQLGLGGIVIRFVPSLSPLPSVTAPPSPGAPASAGGEATPTPIGARLNLGEHVSLAEAARRVLYPVLVPTLPELGQPDEVYLGTPPVGGQVSLVYVSRPGLPAAGETAVAVLLTEFRARLDEAVFQKMLGPGTTVERVAVKGAPAYWIEGAPHEFIYVDPNGDYQGERIRLAANTLLWVQDGVTFRLESGLSRDGALRIAESVAAASVGVEAPR